MGQEGPEGFEEEGSIDGVPPQMSPEDWEHMMPSREPTLFQKVLYYGSLGVVLVLIVAPAIIYHQIGFQAAVVSFMVALLFFLST